MTFEVLGLRFREIYFGSVFPDTRPKNVRPHFGTHFQLCFTNVVSQISILRGRLSHSPLKRVFKGKLLVSVKGGSRMTNMVE
jgi:hypothetical protein